MVSVIIAAYNIEHYIDRCIASVVAQTYDDLEIIVVDDGSTDGTAAIAQRHAETDGRVHLITQANGGLSAARNTGINASHGEWLMMVDGDDCLPPDAIDTLIALAVRTGAQIACGDFSRQWPVTQPRYERTGTLSADEALIGILYQRSIVSASVCGKLYRRDLFDKVQFTEGILYEDLDIIPRLISHSNSVAETNRCVYFYRPTPGSILHTFNSKRFDVLSVTERIEEWAETTHKPAIQAAAADRRLSANFNILGLLASHGLTTQHADVADQCYDLIRRYRRRSLFDPRVRFKNKCGILLSYAGKRVLLRILARWYSSAT